MLTVSEDRKAEIWPEKIHTYPGVISLIKAGIESTLAPSNKSKLSLIGSKVIIKQTNSKNDPADYFNFESILVDPQTCGPLLISCNQSVADKIEALGWHRIGSIY
jgi:selenide,water dikinase